LMHAGDGVLKILNSFHDDCPRTTTLQRRLQMAVNVWVILVKPRWIV